MAYHNQSKSLEKVQVFGSNLEKNVREFLEWENGKVVYYTNSIKKLSYDIQCDGCWPSSKEPKAFLSVTYCNPDTPGHSNENKLQLKLGELILFKSAYPELRSLLVIGGRGEAWLKYVLEVFEHFYDEVIFLWEPDSQKKLLRIKENPMKISLKHEDLWKSLSENFKAANLDSLTVPIDSYLREGVWKVAQKSSLKNLPAEIENQIFQKCMEAAFNRHKETRGRSGSEWTSYREKKWDALWQSRSFFNPGEAAIYLCLKKSGIAFLGDVAGDIAVPSLIHQLGGENVDNTKVSEDFILYSNKYKIPIFIQSKASGGGIDRHGKNIQNRTKEQITRGLFYRGFINKKTNKVEVRKQDFIWISVLDGDWGVTKKTPLKYLHMLIWAGYNHLVAADSLADVDFNFKYPNSLSKLLEKYECETDQLKLTTKWQAWLKSRSSLS